MKFELKYSFEQAPHNYAFQAELFSRKVRPAELPFAARCIFRKIGGRSRKKEGEAP